MQQSLSFGSMFRLGLCAQRKSEDRNHLQYDGTSTQVLSELVDCVLDCKSTSVVAIQTDERIDIFICRQLVLML